MKIKPSPCWLVSLIMVVILFGEPMKMIAVADDGGSFFADFSLLINKEKLPVTAVSVGTDGSAEQSETDVLTRLFFSRFVGFEDPAVGQIIRVRALVSPTGQSINLLNARITYSTSTLRLVEVDSNVSDFSLNLIGDQSAGSVSIIGMQPWPGIATSSVLADLVFMTIAAGQAEINFAPESSALANDGYGTEVFTAAEASSFIVI